MEPSPRFVDDSLTLHHDDCLKILRRLPDASVDAVVTDPPYGLAQHRPDVITDALVAWAQGDRERVPDGRGFMGRDWDAFVPPPAVWDECLRVLKPGGHLVAFAGSRTYDLMGLSIRLAGFEVRDGLQWLYGSGFPKSLDVSKAITATERHGGANSVRIRKARLGEDYTPSGRAGNRDNLGAADNHLGTDPTRYVETELTENGARWEGWGTALKPAHEPIVLARKPLAGTVAANVLAHGTGALNIDGCRVDSVSAGPGTTPRSSVEGSRGSMAGALDRVEYDGSKGRWPSNVLLDEHAAAKLDAATAGTRAAKPAKSGSAGKAGAIYNAPAGSEPIDYGDSGGASRFFPTFRYQAKAPARERPKIDGQAHPTVKPLALMSWLVRLVTPPGGVVLDPFAGSGTTLQAARDGGFGCIGVERWDLAYRLACQRLGLEVETP